MRTTRRHLLSLFGLGAAAAALAPSAGQAAPVGDFNRCGSPAQNRCIPCLSKASSGIGTFPWTCKNGHTLESGTTFSLGLGEPVVGFNHVQPELMARVREMRGENVGITPEWRQNMGNDVRMSMGVPLSEMRKASRAALGLPLHRPSTDAEIARAARLERQAEG